MISLSIFLTPKNSLSLSLTRTRHGWVSAAARAKFSSRNSRKSSRARWQVFNCDRIIYCCGIINHLTLYLGYRFLSKHFSKNYHKRLTFGGCCESCDSDIAKFQNCSHDDPSMWREAGVDLRLKFIVDIVRVIMLTLLAAVWWVGLSSHSSAQCRRIEKLFY